MRCSIFSVLYLLLCAWFLLLVLLLLLFIFPLLNAIFLLFLLPLLTAYSHLACFFCCCLPSYVDIFLSMFVHFLWSPTKRITFVFLLYICFVWVFFSFFLRFACVLMIRFSVRWKKEQKELWIRSEIDISNSVFLFFVVSYVKKM